jgi:hypothetical protein
MKNTLAENLLRFGVKNLKDTDKKKLMEQNEAYWEKVQGISNNPQGKKTVMKEFAANNQLTSPTAGPLKFTQPLASADVYIGASLQAQFQPLVKKVDSAGQNLTAPFGFELDFYLADQKGSTGYPNNKAHQADYFRIKGALLKSGQFQILTLISYTPEFAKRGFETANKQRVSMEVSLANNMLLGNLDAWMGSLRNDINIVLEEMGYPRIPNSLKYNGTQMIA